MLKNRYVNNILLLSGIIICTLLAFNSSFTKLVLIWQNSNTYGHGFLILPISLWLIDRNKHELAQINSKPSLIALFAVGLTSLFWFVGVLSYVNVIEQFALFSLFVVLAWAFYGWKILSAIKFPLIFLYFSIPVGDFLIPYLQFITADISVFLIEMLGIPVFRDGMYIQIPNGNFLVAEACSGIRFLISTITMGVLYSYLSFNKLYKQILFVFLCCVVAIVGNGLRAFLMILIGHLSDMKAAVGFDHLVYGWVFFSIIMGILLVIGHYMSDQEEVATEKTSQTNKQSHHRYPSLIFILFALFFLLLGPLLKYNYEEHVHQLVSQQTNKESIERSSNSKSVTKFLYNWMPNFPDADAIYTSVELSPTNVNDVDVYIARYDYETDEKEIISYRNTLFDADLWSLKSSFSGKIIDINEELIPYTAISIVNMQGEERQLRIIYKVNGVLSANKIQFKFLQLINKIMMTDFGGEVIVLSSANKNETDERLDKFMFQNLLKIKQHVTLVK